MILVCVAMKSELEEIKKHRFFSSKYILTGIGKVNASMHLAESIARNHIKKIYNLGFAGGTNKYNVGDVVLIENASYHDFDLSMFGYKVGQVPGFPEKFSSDKNLVEKVKALYPNIKTGDLYTGDYFTTKDANGYKIYDMEGAALYHVAYKENIPIVSIKVISDIVGSNDVDEFLEFDQNKGAKLLEDIYLKLMEGEK